MGVGSVAVYVYILIRDFLVCDGFTIADFVKWCVFGFVVWFMSMQHFVKTFGLRCYICNAGCCGLELVCECLCASIYACFDSVVVVLL